MSIAEGHFMQTPSSVYVTLLHYIYGNIVLEECQSSTLSFRYSVPTLSFQLNSYYLATCLFYMYESCYNYILLIVLLLYVRVCVCMCVCVHVCVPDQDYGVFAQRCTLDVCLHKMSYSFISIYRSQLQWYGHRLLLHTVTDILC